MRVLLVEDEEAVKRVMVRSLTEAGYQVLEADDGEEALRIFIDQQGTVDLLLTDVVMPGMNGRELGRRIHDWAPDLPVIYVSGYTDGEIARRGLLEPGANFIQKPFSPDAMVQAVALALRITARSTD